MNIPEIPADLPPVTANSAIPPVSWEEFARQITPVLNEVMTGIMSIKSKDEILDDTTRIALYVKQRVRAETELRDREIADLKQTLQTALDRNKLLTSQYDKLKSTAIIAVWDLTSLPPTANASYIMPAINRSVDALKEALKVGANDPT